MLTQKTPDTTPFWIKVQRQIGLVFLASVVSIGVSFVVLVTVLTRKTPIVVPYIDPQPKYVSEVDAVKFNMFTIADYVSYLFLNYSELNFLNKCAFIEAHYIDSSYAQDFRDQYQNLYRSIKNNKLFSSFVSSGKADVLENTITVYGSQIIGSKNELGQSVSVSKQVRVIFEFNTSAKFYPRITSLKVEYDEQ